MRSGSLVNHITVIASILTSVIVSISGLATGVVIFYRTERVIEQNLAKASNQLITENTKIQDRVLMEDTSPDGKTLLATLRDLDVSLVVYNREGQRIGTYGIYRNAVISETIDTIIPVELIKRISVTKKPEYRDILINGSLYDTYTVPLLSDGSFVGLIQLAKEGQIIKTVGATIPLVLLAVVPLSLVITGFLIWRLTKKGLLPLSDLVKEVKDVDPDNVPATIASVSANEEIQVLTQAFNAMLKRIRETMEYHKDFAESASHELKSPLARSVSAIDVMTYDKTVSEQTRKDLKTVRDDLIGLSKTVDSVLTLAKNAEGNSGGFHGSISLPFERIFHMHEKEIREKSLEIRKNFRDSIHTNVPYAHLEIILKNIVANAIKYSNARGVIEIDGVTDDSGMYVITVRDNGIGMSADEQHEVFTRHYRGKNAKSMTGSGIGLQLVKNLCDRYKIVIALESRSGVGTTVRLRIPAIT